MGIRAKRGAPKRKATKPKARRKEMSKDDRAFRRANTFLQAGKFEEALEVFNDIGYDPKIVRESGPMPNTKILEALISDDESAMDTISDEEIGKMFGIGQGVDPVAVFSGITLCLKELGRYDEAIRHCDEMINAAGDTTDSGIIREDVYMLSIRNKTLILVDIAKYEEAAKCCDIGLKVSPDDREMLGCKAIALFKAKKYKEAAKCCKMVLKQGPDEIAEMIMAECNRAKPAKKADGRQKFWYFDRYAAFKSGMKHMEDGKYDEALASFERLYKGPDSIGGKDHDMQIPAVDPLQMADDEPEFSRAKSYRIACYDPMAISTCIMYCLRELKRYDDAARHCCDVLNRLEELAATTGTPPELHTIPVRNMALILIDRGEYDNAIECCDYGLEIISDDPDLLTCKAMALRGAGKYAEAIQCCNEALEWGAVKAASDIKKECLKLAASAA